MACVNSQNSKMSQVIELLDDDEDEDERCDANKENGQEPKSGHAKLNEVLSLLSSSDEESPPSKKFNTKSTPFSDRNPPALLENELPKRKLLFAGKSEPAIDSDDSDEYDLLLSSGPCFATSTTTTKSKPGVNESGKPKSVKEIQAISEIPQARSVCADSQTRHERSSSMLKRQSKESKNSNNNDMSDNSQKDKDQKVPSIPIVEKSLSELVDLCSSDEEITTTTNKAAETRSSSLSPVSSWKQMRIDCKSISSRSSINRSLSCKLTSSQITTIDKLSAKPLARKKLVMPNYHEGDDVNDAVLEDQNAIDVYPRPLTKQKMYKPQNMELEDEQTLSSISPNMIPTPPLPLLNSIGGKLYPDLRHHFIRALIKHAKVCRQYAAQRGTFDASLRAVLILSLRQHPVRTAYSCKAIAGIGDDLIQVLTEAAGEAISKPKRGVPKTKSTSATIYNPPVGKFSTFGPAVLVAMLKWTEDNPKQPLCPVGELLKRARIYVDSQVVKLDHEIDYYLTKTNLCPEWGQVRKLCAENFHARVDACLKERHSKAVCCENDGLVYELLPAGVKLAKRMQWALTQAHAEPGPMRQLPSKYVSKEYGCVTICVDQREGGGASIGLHRLCDELDVANAPYVVRCLKIADYVFFVDNKLAPILIERKSTEDLAGSLADGRWLKQQHNMRKAQYVLGGGEARKCDICYLVEGDASKRTVHGGNVGRQFWNQSVEDVENAIQSLPKLGFSIIRSKSKRETIVKITKVAKEVAWRYANKSIDAKYTYDEFVRRCNSLPDECGDPPTSAEHQNPSPLIVDFGNSNVRALHMPEAAAEEMVNSADYDKDAVSSEGDSARQLEAKSLAQLKQMCAERCLKITGSKKEMVARLLKPRKPEILISRQRNGGYVPKVPSCNAAILVALLLYHHEQ